MTRQVVLIGKPLKRRHSQVMHDAAFDACGIDARYVLREIGPDEVEGDAQAIGAVNNVARTDDGRLIGFNSDAPGFRAGAELAMGRSLRGADVVVAGAGGAAHAVVFALLMADVSGVTVGARSAEAARRLLDRFASVGGGDRLFTELDSNAFRDALGSADLAVNATTVGMIDPGTTIDVDALPDHATVFDLVYVPPETPLLAAARARGLRAANGSEMLIGQAAIAFERGTGVGGTADVMRSAVAPLLADATVTA